MSQDYFGTLMSILTDEKRVMRSMDKVIDYRQLDRVALKLYHKTHLGDNRKLA